jgi:hypothetical protein
MDEDEVNSDDTEIWDSPEAPDNLPEVTHEAPETEVAELPEATHEAPEADPVPEFTPEAPDPETAFEDPEFEAGEADELTEVTPSEVASDDFAHDRPEFETVPAEDLPGLSFETEEIPEYLDDVGTEVADVAEMETVSIPVPEYRRTYAPHGFLTANTYRGR